MPRGADAGSTPFAERAMTVPTALLWQPVSLEAVPAGLQKVAQTRQRLSGSV